jgi:hypothetical protein
VSGAYSRLAPASPVVQSAAAATAVERTFLDPMWISSPSCPSARS